jgi:1-acyl-sn-glycerol-3-phosphate acyltransferase
VSTDPHLARPRTDRTPHPPRYLLHPLRPVARWIIRRRYRVVVHHADRVPDRGPVVFAANHAGVIDGPLLAIFAPRPVHALTKSELFGGRLGSFLLRSGQVPLDRFRTDVAAARSCVRVLRDGGAVGIFPEGRRGDGELTRFHRGAAYFSLVSGATLVPVTLLGTRAPGGRSGSLPPRGSVIDVVIGEPYAVSPVTWPRTREHVEATSRLLWEHMRGELDRARRETGRELPGPLPAGDLEADPATGVSPVPTPENTPRPDPSPDRRPDSSTDVGAS